MPQLEQLDTFASQIFWLAITFGLLLILCWRVLLPRVERILIERQQRIDADLRRAKELNAKAEETLTAYQTAIATANADAQAAVRAANDEMAAQAAARERELSDRLSSQADEAATRIAKAKQDALANIWPVVSDTAAAATARLAGKKPTAKELETVLNSLQKGA